MWSNILTGFYLAWLLAVLLFLWLIWRDSVKRAQQLEQTLVNATLTAAEASRHAAEAARLLALRQAQEKGQTNP
jgi:hypothetical protein